MYLINGSKCKFTDRESHSLIKKITPLKKLKTLSISIKYVNLPDNTNISPIPFE